MSGIFDLFNGTGNSAKQPLTSDRAKQSLSVATGLGRVGGVVGKNVFSRPKPKGLSVRSISDLNVAGFNDGGAKSPKKKSPVEGSFSKFETGRHAAFPGQLSPRAKDKSSKLETLGLKQLRASSSKSRSPDNVSSRGKSQREANVFRKPFTPKINKRATEIYREPEKLAPYHEENNSYSLTDELDREFVRFVRVSKPPVKPFEDEGFESDPELIVQPTLKDFDDLLEDEVISKSPSLPSICDDDDFFD